MGRYMNSAIVTQPGRRSWLSYFSKDLHVRLSKILDKVVEVL